MKELSSKLLVLTLLVGLLYLSGCGDDEPDPIAPPVISITSMDFDDTSLEATGQVGQIVEATINVRADGGFNTMTITKTGGEAFTPIEETNGSANAPSTFSFDFSYALVPAEIDVSVTFTITVVDDTDDGNTTTETLSVITIGRTARVYSAILLAPPANNDPTGSSTSETFFSTNTGEIYSASDVINAGSTPISEDIDFGFYATGSSNHLASPQAFESLLSSGDPALEAIGAQINGWSRLNGIGFRNTSLDAGQFLEITYFEDIDAAFLAGTDTPSGWEVTVEAGDVIAFQTDQRKDGSRRGLLLVRDIIDGNGNGDFFDAGFDQIELEIIVQEDPN